MSSPIKPPANSAVSSNVIQSASVTNPVSQPFHDKNNTYRLRSSSLHGSSQYNDKSSDENKENFPPGTPLHHDPAINNGVVSALSSIPSWLEEDISRVANPTPSTSDTHSRIVMPVIRGRSLSPKALSKRSRSTSPESDKDNKMRRFNSFREVIEGKPKLPASNCPILPSPPALFTSTINPYLEKEKALEFVTNAVGQPYHDKVKTSLPLSSASHDGSQDLDTSSDEDDENRGNIPPGTHDGLHTATPTAGSKRKVTFQEVSITKRLRSTSIPGLRPYLRTDVPFKKPKLRRCVAASGSEMSPAPALTQTNASTSDATEDTQPVIPSRSVSPQHSSQGCPVQTQTPALDSSPEGAPGCGDNSTIEPQQDDEFLAVMDDPFLESVESCKSWGIEKGYLLGTDHDQSTIGGVQIMGLRLVDELIAKRLDLRLKVLREVVIGNIHINAIPSCDQMKESCKALSLR